MPLKHIQLVLPDAAAQLHQVAVVMLEGVALVVENHRDARFLVVGFPLRHTLRVGVARFDESEPDVADEFFKLVGSWRGTCHLALQTDIVEHEGQLHAVRGTQRIALGLPGEEVEVGRSTALS